MKALRREMGRTSTLSLVDGTKSSPRALQPRHEEIRRENGDIQAMKEKAKQQGQGAKFTKNHAKTEQGKSTDHTT